MSDFNAKMHQIQINQITALPIHPAGYKGRMSERGEEGRKGKGGEGEGGVGRWGKKKGWTTPDFELATGLNAMWWMVAMVMLLLGDEHRRPQWVRFSGRGSAVNPASHTGWVAAVDGQGEGQCWR